MKIEIEKPDMQEVVDELCCYIVEYKDFDALDLCSCLVEKYYLNSERLDQAKAKFNED